MYNYEWDPETGGYLLNTKITGVIKEVRPVFKEELLLLGFDRQFNWQIPDTDQPLMWAEGRRYIYHGECIGEAAGGGLFELPTLKANVLDLKITPVNVARMVEKNQPLLNGLIQRTLKFIYSTFQNYQNKVDIVYVAFSGGKDSLVLLDLVHRALPHDQFIVVFADTTMEMDDTYRSVELAKERWNDIRWYTARSHLTAPESWNLIGPPSQKMRWCCSVHKTVPQVLLIKELVEKDRFKTLVYVGVRAEESEARSQYNEISESTKHVMQTGCYPIHEWNTSELFVYILANNLLLNSGYRKGLSRAGCIFCPMSSNWSFTINGFSERKKTDLYVNLVEQLQNQSFSNMDHKEKFFNDVRWKYRLSGRDLKTGDNKLVETSENGNNIFLLLNPSSKWQTWVSTIGYLHQISEQVYTLEYNEKSIKIICERNGTSIKISFNAMENNQTSIRLMHLLRNALNKAAYCIGCKICEAECPVGAIKFINGVLSIEGCIHCSKCLDLPKGCIIAKSLSIPSGGTVMVNKSISAYYTRGFREDWLNLYFELGSDFWGSDRLGKNMFLSFKVWLREAGLLNGLSKTPFGEKLSELGASNILVWAAIFINLAYESTLINWYVKALDAFQPYNNTTLKLLLSDQYSVSVKESAIASLKETLKASPIGQVLGAGHCEMKGNSVVSITKSAWENPEPLAILFSLYRFAEASDRYFSFTLTDLLADSPDRPGISPAKLFNISRETLERMLYQLSHDHSDFIKVVFNKDLDNIYLSGEKTSLDVVELF